MGRHCQEADPGQVWRGGNQQGVDGAMGTACVFQDLCPTSSPASSSPCWAFSRSSNSPLELRGPPVCSWGVHLLPPPPLGFLQGSSGFSLSHCWKTALDSEAQRQGLRDRIAYMTLLTLMASALCPPCCTFPGLLKWPLRELKALIPNLGRV